MITIDFINILPTLFLGFAILSLWLTTSRRVTWSCFGLAVVFALLTQQLLLSGFFVLLGLGLLCSFLSKKQNVSPKTITILHLVFIPYAAGLLTHVWGGFNRFKVLSNAILSPDSVYYSLYLNFDKPTLGFFYLIYFVQTATQRTQWKKIFKNSALALFACAILVLGSAFAMQYLRFSPKIPEITPIWIFSNLFLTCIAEEAFFRGYVQKWIVNYFKKQQWSEYLGLTLAACLFGASHFAGGWGLMFLATLSGWFYGWAYLKSGHLEASILAHFGVNAVHFFLFSYPALLR